MDKKILSYSDIRARQRNLINFDQNSNANCKIQSLYENLNSKYSYNNAKIILENWRGLDDNEIRYMKAVANEMNVDDAIIDEIIEALGNI